MLDDLFYTYASIICLNHFKYGNSFGQWKTFLLINFRIWAFHSPYFILKLTFRTSSLMRNVRYFLQMFKLFIYFFFMIWKFLFENMTTRIASKTPFVNQSKRREKKNPKIWKEITVILRSMLMTRETKKQILTLIIATTNFNGLSKLKNWIQRKRENWSFMDYSIIQHLSLDPIKLVWINCLFFSFCDTSKQLRITNQFLFEQRKRRKKSRENTSNKNVFLFVCYFSSIPMINFHIFFSYWPFRNSYLSFSNIFKWWMVMFFIVPFHKLLVQFFINRDKFTSFPSLSMFFLSVFFYCLALNCYNNENKFLIIVYRVRWHRLLKKAAQIQLHNGALICFNCLLFHQTSFPLQYSFRVFCVSLSRDC